VASVSISHLEYFPGVRSFVVVSSVRLSRRDMVKALYKADIELCRIFHWCRTPEFYRRQLDQLIRLIGAYRATH
jgi:hypothetical protein